MELFNFETPMIDLFIRKLLIGENNLKDLLFINIKEKLMETLFKIINESDRSHYELMDCVSDPVYMYYNIPIFYNIINENDEIYSVDYGRFEFGELSFDCIDVFTLCTLYDFKDKEYKEKILNIVNNNFRSSTFENSEDLQRNIKENDLIDIIKNL